MPSRLMISTARRSALLKTHPTRTSRSTPASMASHQTCLLMTRMQRRRRSHHEPTAMRCPRIGRNVALITGRDPVALNRTRHA